MCHKNLSCWPLSNVRGSVVCTEPRAPASGWLRYDLVHLHPGVILAMPNGALVLLLALELEYDGLLTTALRGDGALDARAAERRARSYGVAINYGHNAVEFDFRAYVAGQRLDFNRLAWRDAI